ncbi:DNA cytosine methyltransferase [Psychroserpens luteus]|uniref:DNA (cytosine-5-)-methyltransferase n=1 Tax=Psychroserpens luteus TaxID=1434066 RepID=A0ABW5ZUW9_9FLAO|nr:DNA cytosine methyltransferase [Psychroserpens luteus]
MEYQKGINVLSLFDGISCTQQSLKELNITIKNYYSSEIDKNAIKVTQHHFPETQQLGDIGSICGNVLPQIDLLIGGSPCQDLSSLRKNREGLDGDKSSLFFHALRLLDEIKPKYFLFENVGSMSKDDRRRFDELLGVEGLSINSNLVSAQNRHRIYWTNIPGVIIPQDRNINLKNIIESGYVDRDKSNCVLTKNVPHTKNGLIRYLSKSIGQVVFHSKPFTELPKKEKLDRIESITDAEVKDLFRLFTVKELEQLQTLPKDYVGDVLKKTPSKHAIGNGFTVEVIKHILTYADFNNKKYN